MSLHDEQKYKNKYLKYKFKYTKLVEQRGGTSKKYFMMGDLYEITKNEYNNIIKLVELVKKGKDNILDISNINEITIDNDIINLVKERKITMIQNIENDSIKDNILVKAINRIVNVKSNDKKKVKSNDKKECKEKNNHGRSKYKTIECYKLIKGEYLINLKKKFDNIDKARFVIITKKSFGFGYGYDYDFYTLYEPDVEIDNGDGES
jgi:hypothetical protein